MMDLQLLTPEQVSQLGALVSSSSKIVILGHSRPDGDAIGSTLAWSEYLSVHYGKRSQRQGPANGCIRDEPIAKSAVITVQRRISLLRQELPEQATHRRS